MARLALPRGVTWLDAQSTRRLGVPSRFHSDPSVRLRHFPICSLPSTAHPDQDSLTAISKTTWHLRTLARLSDRQSMGTISFAHFDMRASSGLEANGNEDKNAISQLEALLHATDDEDLDLALSIIQELDTSLLEPESPSIMSSSNNPEELLMLQALYPDSSISSDASFTELLTTATAAASLTSPTKRREKKCTYQNRRVRTQLLRLCTV